MISGWICWNHGFNCREMTCGESAQLDCICYRLVCVWIDVWSAKLTLRIKHDFEEKEKTMFGCLLYKSKSIIPLNLC